MFSIGLPGTLASASLSLSITSESSPDGTMLMPGSAGSLVTSAGTWTFGTVTNSFGNAILLNGQTTPIGWGTEIEVANGNQLYADNSSGWYQWTGSGWSGTSNPTPASPSPP